MHDDILTVVRHSVASLYEKRAGYLLGFHNYSHVRFVEGRVLELGLRNNSNINILLAAALLHDVNYLVDRESEVWAGRSLRGSILRASGADEFTIDYIEDVVCSADVSNKNRDLSMEARALSDADMLYKILPMTPVLFAREYMAERRIGLRQLGEKIVRDQVSKFNEGNLFFDEEYSTKYHHWAVSSLGLWCNIIESLNEDDIKAIAGYL